MLGQMMGYIIERSQDFTTALQQHLYLTFISIGISVVVGLLAGIVSTRVNWLRAVLLAVGNIGRTLPSLAVLALAIPFLGIGTPPTVLAMVFIGTLPVLINTIVGIDQVDDFMIEAARGMGMSDVQVLTQVELPIAIPVIMAGIRTAAVLVVASAVLAGFIGGGGLGDLILRGHALNEDHIMLAGAIPATLLAFYFEEMFSRLESWATPEGLKVGERGAQLHTGGLPDLLTTVLAMPLVFGALLPWETFMGEGDTEMILVGLDPKYLSIGLTALVLGLLVALRPRSEKAGGSSIVEVGAAAVALIALLVMVVGFVTTVNSLPTGHSLGSGIYIELVSVAAIAVIAVVEAARGRRGRRREAVRAEPAATPAG